MTPEQIVSALVDSDWVLIMGWMAVLAGAFVFTFADNVLVAGKANQPHGSHPPQG